MLNLANRFRQTSICLNNCYKNKYIARSITVFGSLVFSVISISIDIIYLFFLALLSLATQTHENDVNEKTVTS